MPIPIPMPDRPIPDMPVPVPVLEERPTNPAFFGCDQRKHRDLSVETRRVAPVSVPEVRLEEEDVVREEFTELLDVADVRLDCAYNSDEQNRLSNPQTTNDRIMA
jgi:hypothetical protein